MRESPGERLYWAREVRKTNARVRQKRKPLFRTIRRLAKARAQCRKGFFALTFKL